MERKNKTETKAKTKKAACVVIRLCEKSKSKTKLRQKQNQEGSEWGVWSVCGVMGVGHTHYAPMVFYYLMHQIVRNVY